MMLDRRTSPSLAPKLVRFSRIDPAPCGPVVSPLQERGSASSGAAHSCVWRAIPQVDRTGPGRASPGVGGRGIAGGRTTHSTGILERRRGRGALDTGGPAPVARVGNRGAGRGGPGTPGPSGQRRGERGPVGLDRRLG